MYVSKIQLDNVLALTVNHTLIFVNVPTSANMTLIFFFFEAFRFLLPKVNWSEGEYTLTNSLRCTTIKAKFLSE